MADQRGTAAVMLSLAALAIACSDEPSGPSLASISVTVVTSGVDLDPDGYSISIDGGNPTAAPANGTTSIAGLAPGEHTLTIGGLDENCSLAETSPFPISVVEGSPASVTLHITCTYANTLAYISDNTVFITSAKPGSVPRAIAQGYSELGWSPDGSTLALLTPSSPWWVISNPTLYLADANGGNQRQLYSFNEPRRELVDFHEPIWSPDGKTILLHHRDVSSPAAGQGLYTYRVSTNGDHDPFFPSNVSVWQCGLGHDQASWSPDGSRVVMHGAFSHSICLFSADGTFERALAVGTLDPNVNGPLFNYPSWSPDGSRITFTGYDSLGMSTIRTMSPDGTGEIELTQPAGPNTAYAAPRWSPDGIELGFILHTRDSETGALSELYVMDADGSNPRKLTSVANQDVPAKWSRDGTRIAYYGTNGLTVILRDGSEVIPISSLATSFDWRP